MDVDALPPISRLPGRPLQIICECLLEETQGRIPRHELLSDLMQVCPAWERVLLNTPRLWARIKLDDCSPENLKQTDNYLSLSRNARLTIVMDFLPNLHLIDRGPLNEACHLLLPHLKRLDTFLVERISAAQYMFICRFFHDRSVPRLRYLDVNICPLDGQIFNLELFDQRFPALQELHTSSISPWCIGGSPHLLLTRLSMRVSSINTTIGEIYATLAGCPNLLDLKFQEGATFSLINFPMSAPTTTVNLGRLRKLAVEYAIPEFTKNILAGIIYPATVSISIVCLSDWDHETWAPTASDSFAGVMESISRVHLEFGHNSDEDRARRQCTLWILGFGGDNQIHLNVLWSWSDRDWQSMGDYLQRIDHAILNFPIAHTLTAEFHVGTSRPLTIRDGLLILSGFPRLKWLEVTTYDDNSRPERATMPFGVALRLDALTARSDYRIEFDHGSPVLCPKLHSVNMHIPSADQERMTSELSDLIYMVVWRRNNEVPLGEVIVDRQRLDEPLVRACADSITGLGTAVWARRESSGRFEEGYEESQSEEEEMEVDMLLQPEEPDIAG